MLEKIRRAYSGKLYYGGGVAGPVQISKQSANAGFDGAIISTALHRGIVPVEWIRRGYCC